MDAGDITNLTQKGADADTWAEAKSTWGFHSPDITPQPLRPSYYIGTAPTPPAPTDLAATAGDGQVSIAFTAPSNDGGPAISDYKYELDDSGTWISASTATSPVVITGLTNGTAYSIKLRAVNSEGNGAESAAVSVLPATTANAPTDLVATAGDGQVSIAFTAPSNDGGPAISDYEV